MFPAWGSAEGPLVSHAVLPSLLGKSLWLGDGFMEVWVRRLAVWLTSILSVSRTVLLWFGPLDTTQTIPQPCKSRGGLGGLEQGGRSSWPSCWGGLGWPGSPSFLSALWGRAGDRWGGGGTGREQAGTTSVFSFQGLLLLQLSGRRLPAAATARQSQQDPHCGLGRSRLLAPAGPRALWGEP